MTVDHTADTATPLRTELSVDGEARVRELMGRMTLEEKLAQLVGLWEGRGGSGEGGDVAPMQDAMQAEIDELEAYATHGLGQLTRVFGTTPVEPVDQAQALARKQLWLQQNTRLGIPALVHEECLTGLAAWKATTFPAPPSWGASFHPELVEEMGRAIGESMRSPDGFVRPSSRCSGEWPSSVTPIRRRQQSWTTHWRLGRSTVSSTSGCGATTCRASSASSRST